MRRIERTVGRRKASTHQMMTAGSSGRDGEGEVELEDEDEEEEEEEPGLEGEALREW